jgi:hypothetical protein
MTHPSLHPRMDQGQRPYYVVTPPYSRHSAGVRVLHLTIHHLNRSGQAAFAAILPSDARGKRTSAELCTPELSDEIAENHFERGLTPIVVYPEIITGNPLRAAVAVRFYLNFPGLIGGSAIVDVNEIRFGYSKLLASTAGAPENVLHVPVIDTTVFSPEPAVKRDVTCFYAHKYIHHFRGEVFGLPPGCIEITGGGATTPGEVAELLRRSSRLYLFEDSALGTEAVLCGCPVILMYNKYFKVPLLKSEIGENGFATSDDPAAVQHAERTIEQARHNYFALWERFPQQLDRFVQVTQARANSTEYLTEVDLRWLQPSKDPSTEFRRPTSLSIRGARGLLCCLRSFAAAMRGMLRKR